MSRLEALHPGMTLVWGGDQVVTVSEELAAAFRPGDAVIVVDGELLHLPAAERDAARVAVDRTIAAFGAMGSVTDDQISDFFGRFAAALADDETFGAIAEANERDVAGAAERGRSTTRLILSDRMREGMIEGLLGWQSAQGGRGRVEAVIEHEGWRVEQVRDGLGTVGFVFEGRPNVFADATGVIRGGNTVVFRIGSAALGTARAIVRHALDPALEASGLPRGAASLVDDPSRASGWALFDDPRLVLAVARGSGRATAQLGAVARQAGNAVSLHGTGGAWIVAGATAAADIFEMAVFHSLDRKVCNTLNTCCIVAGRADELVPVFLGALEKAAARLGTSAKLHVAGSAVDHVPQDWFRQVVPVTRAVGEVEEPQAEVIAEDGLGDEWEWEGSPEVTLAIAADVDEAVAWFNRYSPRFIASLVSADEAEHRAFFDAVDAPFVGNGFTRWVDGQYALNAPELGLSNWQHGRLFGRGGILSGDSVYTIRSRAVQEEPDVGR